MKKNGFILGAVFLALTLSGLDAKPSRDEVREITYAKKAFQDGLYDVAILKFNGFLSAFPKTELEAEAKLLLGQSFLFEGEAQKAHELLGVFPQGGPDTLKAEFIYWDAESLFAQKNWEQATALYQSFLKDYPDNPLAGKARFNLSTALLQTQGEAAALAILEPLLKNEAEKNTRQEALLQKVRILISAGKLEDASLIVDQLSRSKMEHNTQLQVYYWTAELARQADKTAKALENYQKICSDSRAYPRELLAKSWYGNGQVLKGLQKWQEASNSFAKAYSTSLDPELMQAAITGFLNAQVKNDSLTKGALEVRKWARDRGGAGVSAFYAIGLFYFNAANYDAAITELDNLAGNFPDSSWKWPAQFLIAESLLKKNDRDATLQRLNVICSQTVNAQLALDARFRLAEIEMDGGDADKASKDFLDVARKSESAEQSENAYYHSLLALSKTNNLDAFSAAQDEFEKKFQKSNRLNDILMEKAKLLEKLGKGGDARKIYETLAQNKQDVSKTAEALFSLARSQFQAGQNEPALQNLQQLEKNYPDFSSSADVVYLRILAQDQAGLLQSEALRNELNKFIERFPNKNSDLTARAMFKIAETYFTQGAQGDYGQAQTRFQEVADKFPKHELAVRAIYYSGLSAIQLGNFKDAISILEKIPAESPIKGDARAAQIRCYMLQANWQDALRIADSVITDRPEDQIWAEASLRKAGCLYTLAEKDTKLYALALDTVNKILASKAPNIAQRNEAGCIKGETLQKMQKSSEALAAYLDVVYGRVLPPELSGQPAQPESYWFIRSGNLAAQMLVDQGNIKGAVEIYRILERLNEPGRDEIRKKIEELKSANFFYEES
ncbi:MAG: tetratricopeptide repeat protein [Methylacidiphilales bacterium]|nr:tetratricopeptide repeat protein [Candidatus Methylacidiphilales bacterium]